MNLPLAPWDMDRLTGAEAASIFAYWDQVAAQLRK